MFVFDVDDAFSNRSSKRQRTDLDLVTETTMLLSEWSDDPEAAVSVEVALLVSNLDVGAEVKIFNWLCLIAHCTSDNVPLRRHTQRGSMEPRRQAKNKFWTIVPLS